MNNKLKQLRYCISLVCTKRIWSVRIIITLIVSILSFYSIMINGMIVDSFGKKVMYKYLGYSVVCFLLIEVLSYLSFICYKKIYRQVSHDMSLMAVHSWYKKEDTQRNKFDANEILSSIKNDCGILCRISINSVSDMGSLVLNFIVSFYLLYRLHYLFIVIAFVFSILEITQLHKRFFSKQDKYEKESFRTLSDVNTWSIGIFDRFEHIKIFHITDWARNNFIHKVQDNYDVRTRQSVLSTLISRAKYLPSWLCEAIFYVAGCAIIIQGNLSLGSLVAGIGFMSKYIKATSNIMEFIKNFSINLNAFDRLEGYGLFDNREEVLDLDRSSEGSGKIVVDSVDFSYGAESVFSDLNMTIPLKGILLIKGSNGSGKSTLLSLLAGINKPTSGDILVDGVNTKDYTLNTYNKIYSFVFQDGLILDRSILENISFFDSIDQDRLEEMKDSIFKSAEELYFRENVNASGDSISGGEKKRILIARSLYKDNKILIMDEADTNLDKVGISELLSNLERMSNDKLIIIVSHNYEMLLRSGVISYFLDLDKGPLILKAMTEESLPMISKLSKVLYKNNKSKHFHIKATGSSMEPTYQEGDVVLIIIGKIDFKVGDIVLYDGNNKAILHRIIAFRDNFVICKGDNNLLSEKVGLSKIIGKVII